QKLKNHFVLGFVPFGGEFDDLMKPIINEIKTLEKGTLFNIAGQDIWVIAALGVITADLPQGNDLADMKRHSGNQGCRSCLVSKERLCDLTFDIKLNARYHHLTDKKMSKLEELVQERASQKTINDYCTKHGLSVRSSILNQLTRNRHLQTPQDAYHAVAGKVQRLIDCTFSILSPIGKSTFLKYWKNFETPSN
ncbi:21792_t:CDS:1, partial [Gigaspora margarita]